VKLVLFDIDGTLLLTDGAGRRAIHRALTTVFGDTGPADHRFDGKTDPQIVRELMRIAGRHDTQIDAEMQTVFDAYVGFLREELRTPGGDRRTMPGIPELLDAVEAHGDAVLGLLTGNLVAGARAKLESVGIDPGRFVVGAYGSDHEDRSALPAIAQRRLHEQFGIDVRGPDIVVIGDTPSDIACGRALGVRAIGVATGSHTVAELAACAPASVFQDLADTTAVIEAIFA
jgi:phosphoglycolate phosphatase